MQAISSFAALRILWGTEFRTGNHLRPLVTRTRPKTGLKLTEPGRKQARFRMILRQLRTRSDKTNRCETRRDCPALTSGRKWRSGRIPGTTRARRTPLHPRVGGGNHPRHYRRRSAEARNRDRRGYYRFLRSLLRIQRPGRTGPQTHAIRSLRADKATARITR